MDHIVCKNCFLPFDCPRILPCGHSFCSECLEWTMKKKSFVLSGVGIICFFCPTCQQLCEADPRLGVKTFESYGLMTTLVDLVFFRLAPECQKCPKTQDSGWKIISQMRTKHQSCMNHVLGCCFKCQSLFCRCCLGEHDIRDHIVVSLDDIRKSLYDSFKQRCDAERSKSDKISVMPIQIFSNDSSFITRHSKNENFDPTSLAVGHNDRIVMASRQGLVKVFTREGEWISDIKLLPMEIKTEDEGSNPKFSRCHNFGRVSPCHNFSIWSLALTSKDHFIYTIQHSCPALNNDIDKGLRVLVAEVQTIDGQLVAECSIDLDEKLKRELHISKHNKISITWVKPRNILNFKDGPTLVSDVGLHCLHIFDIDHKHIRSFGGHGDGKNRFKEPRFLAERTNGSKCYSFMVVDSGNSVIKIFSISTNGNKLKFDMKIKMNNSNRRFRPFQVVCDDDGNFYVVERGNPEILMFDRTGEFFLSMINRFGSFYNNDIIVARTSNALIFLLKSKPEKGLWDLRRFEWSIVHHKWNGTKRKSTDERNTTANVITANEKCAEYQSKPESRLCTML